MTTRDNDQELAATLQGFASPAHAIAAIVQWAKGAEALGDLQVAVDDAVENADTEEGDDETEIDEPA